ncbi:MAG: hypothetical protein WC817_02290 [Patescibacteria group bacterium]|jgi:EamA domain-containing membrane protein RarD
MSALTVIIADSILKRVSSGTILLTLRDPLMMLVYLLYFIQLVLGIYIFIYKGELAIYANYYIIFYSILSVIFGIIFFKEHLSFIQIAGIIMALLGAVLIHSAK